VNDGIIEGQRRRDGLDWGNGETRNMACGFTGWAKEINLKTVAEVKKCLSHGLLRIHVAPLHDALWHRKIARILGNETAEHPLASRFFVVFGPRKKGSFLIMAQMLCNPL
jgi:hypothetical protein